MMTSSSNKLYTTKNAVDDRKREDNRLIADDNDPHTVVLPDVLDWMEWPVNCFLKALGQNLYLGQLDTWWLVRNNLKLKKMICHNDKT